MTLDEAIKHCEEEAEEAKRMPHIKGGLIEKCGQEHIQLAGWLRELKAYKEQETCEDAISRKFEEIVAEYPPAELCAYPEYRGKPYYSIKYEENGERFVGFGTYSPEVLSRYLREYFMVGAQEPRKADEKNK